MLEGKYNAKEAEKKWQKFWEDLGIYKFDINTPKEKIYSIDNPPPTVSGKIHIGHVFSYSQIEMMARYMRMKGYNVFYPFGFDDNGLPTERLVEKQIGKKANQISREDFNKLCLETTEKYEKSFKELFKSLGFSADWDLMYSTISPKAQKTAQKSFIDLYNKNKVYHSESPCLWCTECKTSIAQAELDTKEVKTKFNYLNFYIPELEENLEIATTRPEFLPGCVAVFVNPKDTEKAKYIGKEIEVPLLNYKVPIIGDEKVDMEKGTGAVMCCTFGDATDVEWWKKYNLPLKQIIGKDGRINESVEKYGGLKAEEARKQIIEDLSEAGYLLKQEDITHQIGVHERCGTPAEFSIGKQWYIDILSEKERFLKAGNQINWNPQNMKARYDDWVKNLQWDWGISRQRYFGVPFPVWYCNNCGEPKIASEDQLPVNPLNSQPNEPCTCGCMEFTPEKDVMDTWATSSVTPLINLDWGEKENGELMKKLMPMSLRPNAHDIIRTWDFYTIVKNLYHTGEIPWENIMIAGHVLASKGEKISKSKNNGAMEPEKLLENYSADAIRYWTASGRLGNDVMFSEASLREANKFINKIWNVSKFATMHLEDFDKNKSEQVELLPMDKYILSKLGKVMNDFSSNLDKYEPGLALKSFEKFFWEYCDNYVEIVKHRLYNPDLYGKEARMSGQKAIYESILQMLKMGSIYMPHITEEIYQQCFRKYEKEESIHQSRIDAYKYKPYDNLIRNGDATIDLISKTRGFKSERNLSLRTPIKSSTMFTKAENLDFVNNALLDIKNATNCKNIQVMEGQEEKIENVEIDWEDLKKIEEEKRRKKEMDKLAKIDSQNQSINQEFPYKVKVEPVNVQSTNSIEHSKEEDEMER